MVVIEVDELYKNISGGLIFSNFYELPNFCVLRKQIIFRQYRFDWTTKHITNIFD